MTKPCPSTTCRHCGRTFIKPRKRSVFCSPNCAVERQAKRMAIDECWPWIGSTNNKGYGRLSYNGRFVYAHRLALEAGLGRGLVKGEEAMHSCDNPPCCNPAHLIVGSHSDNMKDAVAKGRLKPVPPINVGELHGQSKLTEGAVREIRASEAPHIELASRYGVKVIAISKVKRRLTWRHI